MNVPRRWLMSSALVLSLLAPACGRIPATHYYVIDVQPPIAASRGSTVADDEGLVVGVAPFHVNPPYDQDRLVYRVGSDSPEIGFYHYHRWAAPLSRLLPGAIAAAFGSVSGLASIEAMSPGRDYAARLDGRLHLLEEVDLPAGRRLRFHLSLVLRLADGTVVWNGELIEDRSIEADEVADVAAEISVMLAGALREARADLSRALAAVRR